MTWDVKTEFVGTEPVDKALPDGDMTELRKITATHVETGQTYHLKARMGTDAYKKAAMENINAQHIERTKTPETDPFADYLKTELEKKEVS